MRMISNTAETKSSCNPTLALYVVPVAIYPLSSLNNGRLNMCILSSSSMPQPLSKMASAAKVVVRWRGKDLEKRFTNNPLKEIKSGHWL